MRYVTRPVVPEDTNSGFSCGEASIDRYFERYAVKNDTRGIGKTYVLPGPGDQLVLGFYTLSMASVDRANLVPLLPFQLPGYEMPVALIGQLAVAQSQQGNGQRLGEKLLIDAFRRVLDGFVACVGVIVDAVGPRAEAFYTKYDFVRVGTEAPEEWPHLMFVPLRSVREAAAE